MYLSYLFFLLILYGCNPNSGEITGISGVCESNVIVEDCEAGSSLYDYCVLDVNPSSCTYGEYIGPGYFKNQITLHYFGHQY